ncbi:phage holin family protein [Boudabousia marimammalium]|uniref:Phage holin family protein n=1 Tax=Boudabousia marimammalium TaxID=156892 RepID=A0A1Q5PM71_9ACTO|nr:phage holin family protein [Boudabousia marimammalium]OKL48622.1 hypothetical protein BM477_05280 [Boudabousia marimammalium]
MSNPENPSLTERAKAAAASSRQERPTIGTLVGVLSKQLSELIHGEISLVKAKAALAGKQFGAAAGMLVLALVLALYMLERFFRAAEYGLATVLPMWAATLIVGGILLVIVLILLLIAKMSIDKGKTQVPDPKTNIDKGIAAVKKGLDQ